MPLWHTVVGCILRIACVRGDVVRPHDAVSGKSRRENLGVAWHRKVAERRSVHARQGIEHVALARLVGDVVEERAELRTREFDARIGHHLDQGFLIQFSGDAGASAVQGLEMPPLIIQRLLGLIAFNDQRRNPRHEDKKLILALGRHPALTLINRQCSQKLATGPDHGMGPTGGQIVGECQIAKVCPQTVLGNIRHCHRGLAECCGTTRSARRTDLQAVNRIGVGLRQPNRGAVKEPGTVLVG
mmetsp:Transcript_3394/g.5925  ORF Transcript_3394/g.5925 Transcript_3394/m.5925 type:complete len:243 (-) Transcript_3394:683-1411(-)